MKPETITRLFAGTVPPMTIDEVRALTIYAPTGTFRIDEIKGLRTPDRFLLPWEKGDKKECFIIPRVLVHTESGQLDFYGTDGEAVLIALIAKGYLVGQERRLLDRFQDMLEQFDALFDDEGILKSPQTP